MSRQEESAMDAVMPLTSIGIVLCVLQSGSFSGLNLALFGISGLRLEAQASAGSVDAERLLELRRDSNFLLSTVLWGNVGTNVLLTLLTDSVLAGTLGFFFSTFVITFGGEIVPQAYFSRNALQMATLMRPFLRFWQVCLYPIAKPTALMLDGWLGRESIDFLGETELREVIKRYVASPTTEIGRATSKRWRKSSSPYRTIRPSGCWSSTRSIPSTRSGSKRSAASIRTRCSPAR